MPQLSDYLAKIPSANRQQPDFVAMVSLFVQPFIDNQNLWAQIPAYFNLNTAQQYELPTTNFVFDWIGKWVGLARNGLSDAQYVVALQAQIAINHWNGNVPGIYEIWDTVFNGGVTVLVQDNQDMSMFIVWITIPASFDPTIIDLINAGQFDLRPAGVYRWGHYMPDDAGEPIFGCDAQNPVPGGIAGADFGYCVAPLTA